MMRSTDPRLDALEAQLTELAGILGSTRAKVDAIESSAAVVAARATAVESQQQSLLTAATHQQTTVSARLDASTAAWQRPTRLPSPPRTGSVR